MVDEKVKKIIARLPDTPGVYIFLDANDQTLYIGKAISVRKRVRSHFSGPKDARKENFLNLVYDIDFVNCATEEQAFILEAALIKERKPKYNVLLKDNKSYPYIEISKDEFPRVFISRPKDKKGRILFGPFSQGKVLRESLKVIRKIFPYRSCIRMPKKECLYSHIGLCPAPCIDKINAGEYNRQIKRICHILNGQRKTLAGELKADMALAVKKLKFEEAAKLRDCLTAVEILYHGRNSSHSLIELKEILGLKNMPITIEAVDISLTAGTNPVGSLVVFKYGEPYKAGYRKFKIGSVAGTDDYAMIAEVVRRRYTRLSKEKQTMPDLLVIDGGRGQVNAAYRELEKLGIIVKIIGIAKKNEEIWFPDRNKPLVLSRHSHALQLIQRLRDESHRFAQGYHKLLRSKAFGVKK